MTVEYTSVAQEKPEVVLSECRDLVIWINLGENNLGTQAELRRAEKELKEYEEKLDKVRRDIEQMGHELEISCPILTRELSELREELEALFMERTNQQRDESEDDIQEEIDIDELQLNAADEAELERMMKEVKKIQEHNASFAKNRADRRADKKKQAARAEKVKKLYRKIANKTHPDKVKDERLHELFRAATEAFNANDLESLEMIMQEVTSAGSWLMRSLLSRLKEIKIKISNVRGSLDVVYSTEQYRMLKDFKDEEGKRHVKKFYRDRIEREIKQTVEAIRSLDPERYKPKPALSHDKFKTTTTTVMGDINEDELESPWED